MIFHTPYLFLSTVIFFVFFLEYGAEKLQERGLSKCKSYYIAGGSCFIIYLAFQFALDVIFYAKRETDPSVLMNGGIGFIASIFFGFLFVQLAGERLERFNLSEFKSRLIALGIFMALYVGLDTILKAVFDV